MNEHILKRRIAEAVHAASLKAAQEGYENAGISGLCEAGRWECALDAIRSVNLEKVIADVSEKIR
ncbi:MAG: acetyltransferase [Sulfuricaulis sp.]